MKSEKVEKITRFLLRLICFMPYVSLFIAVIANAIDAGPRLRPPV